jgi:hypothetical protein
MFKFSRIYSQLITSAKIMPQKSWVAYIVFSDEQHSSSLEMLVNKTVDLWVRES